LLPEGEGAGFEVLVTVDRRMEYQQNIPASGLALVYCSAARRACRTSCH
jgi:hypothetical protein